jgi:hypothetical protein
MNFAPVRPDLVKYEMRMVSGEDPFAQQQKTPGAFGRFLSGVGRFFGAVAAPMSLIFPPAAIGAAGMYGIGQIGDQMQYRTFMKMQQQQSQPQYISYPGLDLAPTPGGVSPARMPGLEISQQQENVMDLLFARNDMMLESAHKI